MYVVYIINIQINSLLPSIDDFIDSKLPSFHRNQLRDKWLKIVENYFINYFID